MVVVVHTRGLEVEVQILYFRQSMRPELVGAYSTEAQPLPYAYKHKMHALWHICELCIVALTSHVVVCRGAHPNGYLSY